MHFDNLIKLDTEKNKEDKRRLRHKEEMDEWTKLRKLQDVILKEEEAKIAKAKATMLSNAPLQAAKKIRTDCELLIAKLRVQNLHLDI